MMRSTRTFASAIGALMALSAGGTAFAQKRGGVLNIYHRDSPASMAIHEEATISTVAPKTAVFNNLVVYDQHVAQNSLRSACARISTDLLCFERADRAWKALYLRRVSLGDR